MEVEDVKIDGKDFHTIKPGQGIGGVLLGKAKFKKQDRRFTPAEFYVVAFFPRLKGLGKAWVSKHEVHETLSRSPEAAIAKFMDRSAATDDSWERYSEAGWKVRRIRIADLGDPE